MRIALSALLLLMAGLFGHVEAASTFSNFPAANQPLGNSGTTGPTYVPMDQGAGCPNSTPCNTVQSDGLRLGQPIQTNCASLIAPWQYQNCIDTSTSPPEYKVYIGSTFWPLWILNGSTGPTLALSNFTITNLTVSGTLSVGGAANFTGGLTANQIIDTGLSISAPVCTGTGQQLVTCTSGPGSGTVTSVGLSLPGSVFTITGSPVTAAGTLTGSFANQNANYVFAGPVSGGAAPPSFRAMVAADCVLPTTSSIGCVEAINQISHEWINSINASGIPQLSQPAFTDITGIATSAQGGTGLNTSSSTGTPFITGGTWSIISTTTPVGLTNNVKANLASAGTSVTVTADQIAAGTALNGISYVLPSYSQSFNSSTTGAGGMDTGALPTSGYVCLYAIYNPTIPTTSILGTNCATSAGTVYSGSNLPAGYTASAFLAPWPTNGTPNMVAGYVRNRAFQYQTPVAVLNASTTNHASPTSLSISSAVPSNAIDVGFGYALFTPNGSQSAAGYLFQVGPDSTTAGNIIAQIYFPASISAAQTLPLGGKIELPTAQTVYYETANLSSNLTLTVAVSQYDW